MQTYKTYADVDEFGRLMLDKLPFQKGVLLEVLLIDQKTVQRDEKILSWKALMHHVQNLPHLQDLSDDDIVHEIEQVRMGL